MNNNYLTCLSGRTRPLITGLLLALGAYGAQAQVSNYTFTATTGAYAALPAISTQVTAVQADNAVSAPLPIGFAFAFDGAIYTQVVASSNGFLSFNTAAGSTPANSLTAATATVRPLVAPLWDDLSGTTTGRAGYITSGTSPNRVFTFEWSNWKWGAAATAANISFQVKLYETSNLVEFFYRPTLTALAAPTASIGLAGTGSGSFVSLSDAVAAPTASSTTENASIATAPPASQVYRFTPGAFACTAPQNVTATNITPTGASITFAGSAGASSYTVTYTPAGGTPTTVSPNPTASPVNLTGLTLGVSYTVSVTSNCAGGATSSAATATFTTANAAYCTANLGGSGCPANDVISAVQIVGTTLNNTTNTCAVVNGSSYATYPGTGSTTATLIPGAGNYSIDVTSSANSVIVMWIDYNQNGTFEAAEFTRISNRSRAGQPATGTFAVPVTALQGLTKMRIRTRGLPSAGIANTDACTNLPSGQTEDYDVTIAAPAACPAPSAAAVTAITTTGATLNFTGTANATSYTMTYTPAGGTATTVTPAPTASPVALTGLTSGTAYSATITSVCPSGSSASITVNFTTASVVPANNDCATATVVPVTTSCTSPTTGTVAGATQSIAPTAPCGNFPSQNALDVWYSFTATATTHTVVVTPQFDATVDMRSGVCATSTSVLCGQIAANGTFIRTLTALTVGTTYFVRIYPIGNPTPATSGLSICIVATPTAPANNDCASAVTVPVTADCSAPTAGTIAAATQSVAPTAMCGNAGQPGVTQTAADVWYSFTATGTSHLITLAPAFDAAIVDIRTGACATSTSLTCGTYAARTASSRLITGLTAGTTYFARVYALLNNQPLGANAAFTICITAPPTVPANDECVGAITVPVTTDCSSPTAGTVAAATQSLNPTNNCGNNVNAAPDVWYSFTATATSHVISASGQFAGIVDVRSGTCNNSTSLYCNTMPRSNTLNNLTVGTTYYIRIYPSAGTPVGASAAFFVCVTTVPVVPANDDPCGAVTLTDNVTTTSSTAGATNTTAVIAPGIVLPTSCSNTATPKDVWFTMVAPGTSANISVSGLAATQIRVFTATTCSTGFVEVACRTIATTTVQPLVFNGLTAGRTYYIAVSSTSSNGLTGSFTITANAVLGSRSQTESAALQVYPNPSGTGQLTLRLETGHAAGRASLLNVLGQEVLNQPFAANTAEHTMAVRGLAAGVYTLRVSLGDAVLTRKVVLE